MALATTMLHSLLPDTLTLPQNLRLQFAIVIRIFKADLYCRRHLHLQVRRRCLRIFHRKSFLVQLSTP